jgi:hypothetical protein
MNHALFAPVANAALLNPALKYSWRTFIAIEVNVVAIWLTAPSCFCNPRMNLIGFPEASLSICIKYRLKLSKSFDSLKALAVCLPLAGAANLPG